MNHPIIFARIRKLGGLFDEHAIAVRIKPVAAFYRVAISIHDARMTAECRHQHQKRGLRQVEVGEQRPDHTKLETRINKQVGLARLRLEASSLMLPSRKFERAHRGCADGDNAAAVLDGSIELPSRVLGDAIALPVQAVVFDAFLVNRLESAESDVQGDLCDLDAPRTNGY